MSWETNQLCLIIKPKGGNCIKYMRSQYCMNTMVEHVKRLGSTGGNIYSNIIAVLGLFFSALLIAKDMPLAWDVL